MKNTALIIAETTVWKQVGRELAVLSLATGRYAYFTPSTATVLEFFRAGSTPEALLQSLGVARDSAEGRRLFRLCRLLMRRKLLEPDPRGDGTPARTSAIRLDGPSPAHLRDGEVPVDQLVFLCP